MHSENHRNKVLSQHTFIRAFLSDNKIFADVFYLCVLSLYINFYATTRKAHALGGDNYAFIIDINNNFASKFASNHAAMMIIYRLIHGRRVNFW